MPVEVACPGCGSKLKAPDNMIGKKAKCKKCMTSFRIPGGDPGVDSAGDSQMLSVISMATPAMPDEDESVPMARAVEDSELPMPATPVKPVTAPSGSRPGIGSVKASPPAASTGSSPGRSGVASGPSSGSSPGKPGVASGPSSGSTPGKPGVASKPSKPSMAGIPPKAPVVKPAPVPPPAQIPELQPIEDEEPSEIAELPTVPYSSVPPVSDDPFAFASNPAAEYRDEPKSKKKIKDSEIREDVSTKPPSKPKRSELPAAAAPAQDDPFSFNAAPTPPAKPKTKKQEQAKEAIEEKPKARDKQKAKPTTEVNDPFSFGDNSSPDPGMGGDLTYDQENEAGDDDNSEQDEGPRYKRKGEQGSNKMLMFAGGLGILAIVACIAGIIVFTMKSQPEPAKKSTEKTEEPAPTPAPTPAPAPVPETPKEDPNAGKKDSPKKDTGKKDAPKTTGAPKKDPKSTMEPGSAGMMSLPANITKYQFRPLPAKATPKQELTGVPIRVDVPFDKIKKYFLPLNRKNNDIVVVWQANSGAGRAERLTVESYGGDTGAKVGRFEFEGDGKDVKCDVSTDGKVFAAVVNGKVSAWSLANKTPILEGFDPYADKPVHKSAGLAAVYVPKNSSNILTVSTAGAMHLFEIAGKTPLGEFIPESRAPGKIVQGKNVSVDDAHTSIVLAVGAFIYQLSTQDLSTVYRKINVGGEAGRSFGISVLGTPGRIAYAVETDSDKKKDRALLLFPPNDDVPVQFRWQDSAGEPTNVAWAGADFVVVGAAKGAVWFEQRSEGNKYSPLAMVETPGGKGLHEATENSHWYLIPTSADPTRSVILELGIPNSGLEPGSNPYPTWRLDEKGLWQ